MSKSRKTLPAIQYPGCSAAAVTQIGAYLLIPAEDEWVTQVVRLVQGNAQILPRCTVVGAAGHRNITLVACNCFGLKIYVEEPFCAMCKQGSATAGHAKPGPWNIVFTGWQHKQYGSNSRLFRLFAPKLLGKSVTLAHVITGFALKFMLKLNGESP